MKYEVDVNIDAQIDVYVHCCVQVMDYGEFTIPHFTIKSINTMSTFAGYIYVRFS